MFQQIAHKIGVEHMKKFVKKLNYGKMDIDTESINDFWLTGASKINQFEDINFLNVYINRNCLFLNLL